MRPLPLVVLALPLLACRTHEPVQVAAAQPDLPAAAASLASALPRVPEPPAPVPSPAIVERLAVPGDVLASIVRGPGGGVPRIVFMPGLCSNAYAYLLAFPEAARAHGGVVAIEGDKPCGAPDSGFRSFSWDPAKQDARVSAALAAAGGTTPPRGGLTLVGYSAGAGIGELMVQLWPERYPRVVLIGAPRDPHLERLAHARAVVTMSCSRDVPGRMKDGARRIAAAGIPATYLEMPGCAHGHIADGDRVLGAAFDWLAATAPAASP